MDEMLKVELTKFDLGQVLDGLEVRAKAWEKTADYLQTGESKDFFLAEECSCPDEAQKIANHYREIIKKITDQIKDQVSRS
jgi:hypothetical protein